MQGEDDSAILVYSLSVISGNIHLNHHRIELLVYLIIAEIKTHSAVVALLIDELYIKSVPAALKSLAVALFNYLVTKILGNVFAVSVIVVLGGEEISLRNMCGRSERVVFETVTGFEILTKGM